MTLVFATVMLHPCFRGVDFSRLLGDTRYISLFYLIFSVFIWLTLWSYLNCFICLRFIHSVQCGWYILIGIEFWKFPYLKLTFFCYLIVSGDRIPPRWYRIILFMPFKFLLSFIFLRKMEIKKIFNGYVRFSSGVVFFLDRIGHKNTQDFNFYIYF